MSSMNFHEIFQQQKQYFQSGITASYKTRQHLLRTLKHALTIFKKDLLDAAYQDFKRVAFEVDASELSYLGSELDHTIQYLAVWTEPQKISVPFREFGAHAYFRYQPYGTALVIAPWNYPYVLSLLPAIHALSAGNTVIIKPSECAPAQATMISRIIEYCASPVHAAVVEGDATVAQELIQLPFEYMFFTGSARVGKIVYQHAAEKLIPVTLELGGKCPAIVTESADVKVAAHKIVWGKFFNAGQTCVAPDYVIVPQRKQDQFVHELKRAIKEFYGDNPQQSDSYARIVNIQHVIRLQKLLKSTLGSVVFGGEIIEQEKYCAPTIIACSFDDALMQEEIFGPILPIIGYEDLDAALKQIGAPNSLAVYIFSRHAQQINYIRKTLRAGSFVVNDVLVQAGHAQLPFGGVGLSGFSAYHGRHGFETFSRKVTYYSRKSSWFDTWFYPPYKKWLKRFL